MAKFIGTIAGIFVVTIIFLEIVVLTPIAWVYLGCTRYRSD